MKRVIPKGIMVIGACGSGKSTLAEHLAEALNYSHIEMDKYAWIGHAVERPVVERNECILKAIKSSNGFIMDGSTGWANDFLEYFCAVLFIQLPCQDRIKRFVNRETMRLRDKVSYGGEHYEWLKGMEGLLSKYNDEDAPEWSSYNEDEAFINKCKKQCQIIYVDGNLELNDKVRIVLDQLNLSDKNI